MLIFTHLTYYADYSYQTNIQQFYTHILTVKNVKV